MDCRGEKKAALRACILVAFLACTVAQATTAAATASDGLTSMSRSDDNTFSPTWTIVQQPQSCGLVWFNQTAGAMSEYTILGLSGTESCDADRGESVSALIFQAEALVEFPEVFEALCQEDVALSSLLGHPVVELSSAAAHDGRPAATLRSQSQAFMVVRNACGAPVSVRLSQQVGINFVVHVRTLVWGVHACLTGYIVLMAVLLALFFKVSLVALLNVWRDRQDALAAGVAGMNKSGDFAIREDKAFIKSVTCKAVHVSVHTSTDEQYLRAPLLETPH